MIIADMHDIISKISKHGCEIILLKLRQRGILINHKRIARIYREQGLQLKARRRCRKIASEERVPVELPQEANKLWAMGFVSDSVGFNRKLKILTVIDPVTNKVPVIYPAYSITGGHLS